MKRCPRCGRTLPAEAFHRNARRSDGLAFSCRECARERTAGSRRPPAAPPRPRAPGAVAPGTTWRPDGETVKPPAEFARGGQVEVDELLETQGGRCAICGGQDPEHVDHDPRTGWVRGILCFNCNGGLGRFRDDPGLLAEALTYLKGTTWQRVLIHPGVYQMCSPMRGRPPSRSS